MSGLYDKGREKFLLGQIAWLTDDIKAVFVTSAYTPNFTTHEFLSDIAVGARVAASDSLADKTATGGYAGASEIVWQGFTGAVCAAFVFIKDTGSAATSPLIAYLKEGITNLPLDPNGAKITLLPDPNTHGFFRL